MPARKPASLIEKHETNAEKEARTSRESALRPKQALPAAAPARLNGHPVAESVWRRIMRVYGEIEGEIVTRLDQDLLENYCLVLDQLVEMDQFRKKATEICHELETRMVELNTRLRELRSAQDAAKKSVEEMGSDPTDEVGKIEAKIEKVSDQYLAVLMKAANASDSVVKLDSRVDRKRALLINMQQSLYLTPRARAGTAPTEKEKEPPKSAMARLLGEAVSDVTDFMNNEHDDQ
jgi:phage terminase small subunit